jgi:hypothetical protein
MTHAAHVEQNAPANISHVKQALKPWLSAREAAVYTSLGFTTLAKLRITGEGCVYTKVGNKVIYNKDDLDAWLKSVRLKSTSQDRKQAA